MRFNRMILAEERRFREHGAHRHTSENAEEVNATIYQSSEIMSGFYLAGLLLSYFTWRHHQELLDFYRREFLSETEQPARIVDWALGHGLLTLLAARKWPNAALTGLDISPHSLEFAEKLLRAAGVAHRGHFILGDILGAPFPTSHADRLICAEVLEHVPNLAAVVQQAAIALGQAGEPFSPPP